MPSKPYGPASKQRQDGGPGQRRVLLLETRLLADVVLVGLPNVGKSSLIAALTGARAQVGRAGVDCSSAEALMSKNRGDGKEGA